MTSKSAEPHGPPDGSHAVAASLRRILRPLVRLAISRGLKFQQMSTLLKSVYADAARELVAPGERLNVSRVSVLTGIQRKDLNRLLRDVPADSHLSLSIEAQLFARWLGDPSLIDPDGLPKPLPRTSDTDETESFDALARSVTSDIHPRTILESLLRLGTAAVDENDRVHLLTDRFVPSNEDLSMLEFMRENVHDHLAATVSNLAGRPPMLEQSVFANGLSGFAVEELHTIARRAWRDLLSRTVPAAQRLVRRDRGAAKESRQRMRVGMYFYSEPEFVGEAADVPHDHER